MKRTTFEVHIRLSPEVPLRKLEVRGSFLPGPNETESIARLRAEDRCREWLSECESIRGKFLKPTIKPEAVVVEFIEEQQAECAVCHEPLYGSDMVWSALTGIYCQDCRGQATRGMWALLDDALANEQDPNNCF